MTKWVTKSGVNKFEDNTSFVLFKTIGMYGGIILGGKRRFQT